MTCFIPTWAAMEVSSSGAQGQVKVSKVGALLLADGLALINGNSIEVKSSDGTSQLTGTLFKTETAGSGDSATITGDVYFSEGPGTSTLDANPCQNERVDKVDGTTVRGRISSCSPEELTCGGQSIPMSQVKAIHSNRVFTFKLKAGQTPRLTFETTCAGGGAAATKKEPETKVSTPGDHRTAKRVIVCVVLLCGIACAIAIPIAVSCSQHHHHTTTFMAPHQEASLPPPPMPAGTHMPDFASP
jgi:hypothetical protein